MMTIKDEQSTFLKKENFKLKNEVDILIEKVRDLNEKIRHKNFGEFPHSSNLFPQKEENTQKINSREGVFSRKRQTAIISPVRVVDVPHSLTDKLNHYSSLSSKI